MMMTYHFRLRSRPLYLLIRKTVNNDYYISDRGFLIAVPNDIHGLERDKIIKSGKHLKPWLETTKAYPGHILVIRIGGERLVLKNEVIKAFTNKKVVKHWQIQHKDGNPENCKLNNLVFIPLEECDKYKGTSRIVVTLKNKSTVTYKSVAEAAKALFVTERTLYNFIYKKVKRSVLHETVSKIVMLKSKKSNLSLEEIKNKEK